MSESSKPSAPEQKELLEEVLKQTLELGDTWFILSERWFRQWKDFVNYKETDNEQEIIPPGAIDNSELIETQQSRNKLHRLKPNITENEDFIVVPETAWKLLYSWYGGGPAIARPVIEEGLAPTTHKIVEVNLLNIEVNKVESEADMKGSSMKEPISLLISKKKTVKQLLEECSEVCAVDSDCKLWVFEDGEQDPKQLTNLDSTLEEENFQLNQRIILEMKTKEDPSKSRRTSKSTKKDKETNGKENGTEKEAPKRGKILSYLFGVNQKPEKPQQQERSSGSTRGVCGLTNLGNTCFMNSALQCLSNTQLLSDYFLNGKFKPDINKTNPLGMKGKLAEEYGSLLKEMWTPGTSCVAPKSFKSTIGKFAPQFMNYNQHDAQELLAFLLDGLHEDLNKILKKPYIEVKETDNRPEEEVAKEAWEIHLKRNMSIIVDLFQGQLKSTLVCPKCSHVSVTFDPFMYLSLPLPMEATRDILITFVRFDSVWVVPTKYCFKTPKNGKVQDIKDSITNLTQIPQEKMAVADIHNNKIYSFYKIADDLSSIKQGETVFVFELPPFDIRSKEYIRIQCVHRAKPKKQNFEFFGIPFVLFFTKETTGEALYSMVWTRLKDALKDSDAELNEKKLPFKLCVTTRTGLDCGICKTSTCFGCEIKCNSKPVKLSENGYTVSIDWDDINIDSLKKQLEVVEVDASAKNAVSGPPTLQLNDCLNLFTTDETLGPNDPWFCPNCKRFERANKKFDLWKLPQILVVHLKRFHHTKSFKDKLSNLVEYPIKGLDLSPFVKSNPPNPQVYDLYAVSCHSGNMGGGHYTAYAKNFMDGKWYSFNDSNCTRLRDESQLQTSTAYVLFYKRREPRAL